MQREHGAWGMCRGGRVEESLLLEIRKTATTGGRRTHDKHGVLGCEASKVSFQTSRDEQGAYRTRKGRWAEEGWRDQITKDERRTADTPRTPYSDRARREDEVARTRDTELRRGTADEANSRRRTTDGELQEQKESGVCTLEEGGEEEESTLKIRYRRGGKWPDAPQT